MATELRLKNKPWKLLRNRLRTGRPAMSLLELLLVMAVLSTVVAISWPALRRPLNRSHVQSAAQQLQRDLLAARRAAMESGQVHLFQYQPETGTYYCGTLRQVDMQGSPPDEVFALTLPEESESLNGQLNEFHELPAATTFIAQFSAENESDASRLRSNSGRNDGTTGSWQQSSDSDVANRNDRSTSGGWTRPMRFYPSGRMESGVLNLTSEDGYDIQVEIQGLAGRVRIHPPQRNDSDLANDPSVEDRPGIDSQSSKSTRDSAGTRRSRSD